MTASCAAAPRSRPPIKGARLWLEIEKEPGGFTDFIWKHVGGKPQDNRFKRRDQIPARTEMSEGLAKDLKQRGFNFCGPVISYAFAPGGGGWSTIIRQCVSAMTSAAELSAR